jgi:nitric oxide reductase large subunit
LAQHPIYACGWPSEPLQASPETTMTTITCAAVWLLLPLIVLIGVALWLSESRQQRIQRLHRTGYSQARIAQHLNISRYAVRKALAT